MKAKFVNEALRDVLTPRSEADIEKIFKSKSWEELDAMSYDIPDYATISEMHDNLKQMYRDMEADAPEGDEEANKWGRELQELEDKIEVATKQRTTLDKYIVQAHDIYEATENLDKDLYDSGVDYDIKDVYYENGDVIINVIIDEDDLELKVSGDNVYLVDYEGDIELGTLSSSWISQKENDFQERIKEYVNLRREELSDFLNKYRR